MLRSTFVLVTLALSVVAARPAAAQTEEWANKQMLFERIDADTVRLSGQVEVEGQGASAGNRLAADEAIWNTQTGELKAQGNVLLVTPTSRLSAERVEFNTRTRLGTFYTASGIGDLGSRGADDVTMFGSLEPDVYFYGDVIEKVGDDRYKITRGGFTSCVQPTPRWEVVSKSATINLHDYAILRNAVLRVKDVPVFYLPWMYFPIQDDGRATGFLMPSYGNSTIQGSSLSNAFFWAIDRSQDLTMLHDWYGSRGQGYGSEYRYVASPRSNGDIRFYRLATDQSTVEGLQNPGRRSFELRGSLAQQLPWGLRARGRLDYFSDITTQQLYNQNPLVATASQRQINGAISGAWGGVSLTGNYQRTEQFFSRTNSQVNGYSPSVQSALSSTRIGGLPLYFSATGEAARVLYIGRTTDSAGVVTDNDNSLNRIDFTPSIRAPLTTLPYFTLTTSLAYRYTFYSESLDREGGTQVPVGLTRRYAEMKADIIGPVFSRVFNQGSATSARIKHIIEPTFSVQRTTAIDNRLLIPNLGVIYDSTVGNVTRFSYGVMNRVLVRPATTPSSASGRGGSPREVLTVGLMQSYYTDELASQFDQQYQSSFGVRAPSKYSPIQLNVRSAPTPLTTASARMEYDYQSGLVQNVSMQGGLNHPNAQVTGGWSRRRFHPNCPEDGTTQCYDQVLNTATTLKLAGGRTGGTFAMDWDIARSTVQRQRYIGFYAAQCCGFNIEYEIYNYPSGFLVPQNRRFNFSFTLAGIGTFSNFFGAFGGNGTTR